MRHPYRFVSLGLMVVLLVTACSSADVAATVDGVEIVDGQVLALAVQDEKREWQPSTDVRADENGRFRFTEVAATAYRVWVRADGYAGRFWGAVTNHGREHRELVVCLSRAAVLAGVVRDREGKGVADVTVRVRGALGMDGVNYECLDVSSPVTDSDGRFEIPWLPEGYARISCGNDEYRQASGIFEVYDVPGDDVRVTVARMGGVLGQILTEDGIPRRRGSACTYVPPEQRCVACGGT